MLRQVGVGVLRPMGRCGYRLVRECFWTGDIHNTNERVLAEITERVHAEITESVCFVFQAVLSHPLSPAQGSRN